MTYGPQEEKRDRELSRKVFSGLPDPKASALKWSIIPILFVFYQLASNGPHFRWRDASDSVGVEIGFFGLIMGTPVWKNKKPVNIMSPALYREF